MLKNISFAGIDKNTKIEDLIQLQNDFPLVEFGILNSSNWSDNGNRYPNPLIFKELKGKDLNLSLHLCGGLARNTLKHGYTELKDLYKNDLSIFKRIQLNVIGSKIPKSNIWMYDTPENIEEIIIQQSGFLNIDIYEKYLEEKNENNIKNHSCLIDLSGGKGIYTKDFTVMDLGIGNKIGFAGGINPDNCIEVLKNIQDNLSPEIDFWIDMESGIRNDKDWFSVEKCRSVCEQVYNILN
jgi:hypothetical protein